MTPGGAHPVRALVCEDEPLARRALREYLADVDWIEIAGEAVHGGEALRLIHKLEPDLVFLDVRMPGLSGLEVLDALTHRPVVVFTTAYDEYAVQAFDFGAVDYLVKPFGPDRLLETLDRVRVRLRGEGLAARSPRPDGSERTFTRRLFARRRGAIVPVPTESVVRIEATTGGVTLVTADGDLEMDCTLGEVEARLDPLEFVRVHRSHLVGLRHLSAVRRYDERRLELVLANGSRVVASRQGSRALRDLMNG